MIVKLPANATPEVPQALLGTPRHVWVLEQVSYGAKPGWAEVFATADGAKASNGWFTSDPWEGNDKDGWTQGSDWKLTRQEVGP